MASRALSLHIFVEDAAQEQFVLALVKRLATDQRRHCQLKTFVGRGGHGRVMRELELYLRAQRSVGVPDALLVGIDANCKGWTGARREIQEMLSHISFPAVIACPDPHIERWYLADPAGLAETFKVKARLPRRKCGRDTYKKLLIDTLLSGDHEVMLGGAEYAEEIVAAMDLFRAGKAEPSLRHFLEDLRALFLGSQAG